MAHTEESDTAVPAGLVQLHLLVLEGGEGEREGQLNTVLVRYIVSVFITGQLLGVIIHG